MTIDMNPRINPLTRAEVESWTALEHGYAGIQRDRVLALFDERDELRRIAKEARRCRSICPQCVEMIDRALTRFQ